MIIITQPAVTEAQIDHIVARVEEFGLQAQVMRGALRVVIGVIGPEDVIREKPLAAIPGVESVFAVMKPYKLVAQENGAVPPPVELIGVTDHSTSPGPEFVMVTLNHVALRAASSAMRSTVIVTPCSAPLPVASMSVASDGGVPGPGTGSGAGHSAAATTMPIAAAA